MNLPTCTDKCSKGGDDCFLVMVGEGERHIHFVAPEPFKSPYPVPGEMHGDYIIRLAKAFEDWVNRK